MEELHEIKKALVSLVYSKKDILEEVHTEELGEVIDMIKDLSEAIYYCSKVKGEESE